MKTKKTTENLMNDILDTENVDRYMEENKDELKELSLSAFLQEMLKKYGLKKSELFRKAEFSGSNYGYELLRNDQKTPSRDIVISLCLAFPLTIAEAQYALRCSGLSVLYPRNRRDAYILYALKNKMSLTDLNSVLDQEHLEIIGFSK